jgi:hypothetical protein
MLGTMARGWESKGVESSQQDRSAAADEARGPLSAEARKLRQRRSGLELSRSRVVQELEATTSPVRRAALVEALAFLDGELAKIAADEPRQG